MKNRPAPRERDSDQGVSGKQGAGAADLVRQLVASLVVDREAMASAEKTVADAGFAKPAETSERLRKEWLNDILSDDGDIIQQAVRDPSRHFLAWLSERIKNPFHVSYRAVDRVARNQGPEAAMMLANMRWAQEIAWAHRMRADENPQIAVLASAFVEAARRDPSKAFLGLAESLEEAALEPDYASSTNHHLTADEIRDGVGSVLWVPLFLRYARKTFLPDISKLPRKTLEALAQRAAKEEEREKRVRLSRSFVKGLELWRPSRAISVLSLAVSLKLGSNDLVWLEERFAEAIGNGEEPVPVGPIDTAFVLFVQRNAGDFPAPPSREEIRARIGTVASLGRRWVDMLPKDYVAMGAHRAECFAQWADGVISGAREAPADAVADYGHWLVEHRSHSDAVARRRK
jgi:hypothetical protein